MQYKRSQNPAWAIVNSPINLNNLQTNYYGEKYWNYCYWAQ